MKYLLSITLLFTLASCGSFQNLSATIQNGREIADDLRQTYEDLKPLIGDIVEGGKDIAGDVMEGIEKYKGLKNEIGDLSNELKDLNKESFASADKDGDGALDWMERIAYILALGGGSLEIGRRKLKQMKEAQAAELAKAKAAPAEKAAE